jgi:hypothetical protein
MLLLNNAMHCKRCRCFRTDHKDSPYNASCHHQCCLLLLLLLLLQMFGSPEKRFICLGPAAGFSDHYGEPGLRVDWSIIHHSSGSSSSSTISSSTISKACRAWSDKRVVAGSDHI